MLKGSDTVAGNEFGSSVAISGTTAVVGAPEAHKGAGRAYVFTKTTAGWKQVAELKGSGTAAFGASVAISGHTILVGAPGSTFRPTHTRNASAYVFTETPAGWKQVERLKGSGSPKVAGDFGWSVAVSGATAIVYAEPMWLSYLRSTPRAIANATGWVYIFARTGDGWKQVAKLKQVQSRLCYDCVPENPSPYRVSISGTTVLVTTGYSASVITKTAAGWKQTAELKRPGFNPNVTSSPGLDMSSVSLSGTTAVTGGAGITTAGWAFVFTETPAGWRQIAEWDRQRGYFGLPVAISGGTIIVGAIFSGARHDHPYGQAYVFTKTMSGWKQAAVLRGSTSGFGWSVAISGTIAIVGDGYANDSDRVFVFRV